MTPAEHYHRAEELVREAEAQFEIEPDLASVTALAALAQVHATLATASPVVEYRVPRHPTRPLPPPALDGHGRHITQETP